MQFFLIRSFICPFVFVQACTSSQSNADISNTNGKPVKPVLIYMQDSSDSSDSDVPMVDTLAAGFDLFKQSRNERGKKLNK